MENDIIIGIVITAVALTALTSIVIWSIRMINHIADNGAKTTRETLKELSGGR